MLLIKIILKEKINLFFQRPSDNEADKKSIFKGLAK